jgi:hypothetical protein
MRRAWFTVLLPTRPLSDTHQCFHGYVRRAQSHHEIAADNSVRVTNTDDNDGK